MKSKTSSISTFIILFVVVWIAIVLIRLVMVMDKNNKPKADTCDNDKVCMSTSEYQDLLKNRGGQLTQMENRPSLIPPSYTRERDMRVLHDDLYPAYNRSDKQSFEGVVNKTIERQINVPTRQYNDSYRIIGYLTNEDDEIKTWKLFGKKSDRNRGDFYMIPSNRNYDMKVQITDSMVEGTEKLRDIDTIPNEVKFKSPLLAATPYQFVELPKGDLRDELDI